MCMGTNQLVHGAVYNCLGVWAVENRNPFAAFAAASIFCTATWLVVKLDIYASTRKLILAGSLFMVPPMLETIATFLLVFDNMPEGVVVAAQTMQNFVFVFHVVWVAFMMWLCKAEQCNSVAMPVNFRSVTYLDVYGDLLNRDEDDVPLHILESVAMEEQAVAGHSAQAAEDAKGAFGPARGPGQESLVGRLGESSEKMLASLREECRQTSAQLVSLIQRWDSPTARAMLGPDTRVTVTKLRARIESAEVESRNGAASQPGSDIAPLFEGKVWLRFEWQGAAAFYYCCETDESQFTKPEDVGHISDILIMAEVVRVLEAKVQLCRQSAGQQDRSHTRTGLHVRQHIADALGSSSSSHIAGALGVSRKTHVTSNSSVLSGSFLDLMDRERSPHESGPIALDGSSASLQLVQSDRQRMDETSHFGAAANAAPTFSPPVLAAPQGRKSMLDINALARKNQPPGQVPYRTFCQASLVYLAVWVFSAGWNLCDGGIKLMPRPDAPNETQLELVFDSHWPHSFFKPTGLACHPAAGGAVFIASKYAVHELSPSGKLQPALADCLAGEPDFHAAGIQDISIDCPSALSGARGNCTALLLGTSGERALRCNLAGGQIAGALLLPRDNGWRALAASSGTGFWALGQGEIVELGPQDGGNGVGVQLVPRSSISIGAVTSNTKLHVVAEGEANGGAVVALESDGALRVWPQHGGGPLLRALPGAGFGSWTGMCSTAGSLYLITEGRIPGVWRLPYFHP